MAQVTFNWSCEDQLCRAPEAGRFGKAQTIEGQQFEGLWQDQLTAGGRCGAVLAVAEQLIDALPQQLVLTACQGAAWHIPAYAARCQVGLGV